jgi:hypothetical protein
MIFHPERIRSGWPAGEDFLWVPQMLLSDLPRVKRLKSRSGALPRGQGDSPKPFPSLTQGRLLSAEASPGHRASAFGLRGLLRRASAVRRLLGVPVHPPQANALSQHPNAHRQAQDERQHPEA